MALEQARTFVELVVVTRSWNAGHGSIYTPVTPKNPPNPYLDVPDRDVVTTGGLRLTQINPAYMTRQLSEIATRRGGIQFHLTSTRPIRPQNSPDAWERTSLRRIESGIPEVLQLFETAREPNYRYMAPLRVETTCLRCHAKQGYHVGDIRGGISVTVPAGVFLSQEYSAAHRFRRIYMFIWMIGVAGIGIAGKILARRRKLADQAAETKNLFLTNMSHEIRTPMNGIIGMAELALRSNSEPERDEYLRAAKHAADSLMAVLGDVLDFSKLETAKLQLIPEPFHLRGCVTDVLQTLGASAHRKSLELVCRIAPSTPDLLVGDAGRLRQVIAILVSRMPSNSRKAEKCGFPLSLSVCAALACGCA